jgi:hypothetical protein
MKNCGLQWAVKAFQLGRQDIFWDAADNVKTLSAALGGSVEVLTKSDGPQKISSAQRSTPSGRTGAHSRILQMVRLSQQLLLSGGNGAE